MCKNQKTVSIARVFNFLIICPFSGFPNNAIKTTTKVAEPTTLFSVFCGLDTRPMRVTVDPSCHGTAWIVCLSCNAFLKYLFDERVCFYLNKALFNARQISGKLFQKVDHLQEPPSPPSTISYEK